MDTTPATQPATPATPQTLPPTSAINHAVQFPAPNTALTDVLDVITEVDELVPGTDTSEYSRTRRCQHYGAGLFTVVLTLAASVPQIPPTVIITALICAAVITAWPTAQYTLSRTSLKKKNVEERLHALTTLASGGARKESQRR